MVGPEIRSSTCFLASYHYDSCMNKPNILWSATIQVRSGTELIQELETPSQSTMHFQCWGEHEFVVHLMRGIKAEIWVHVVRLTNDSPIRSRDWYLNLRDADGPWNASSLSESIADYILEAYPQGAHGEFLRNAVLVMLAARIEERIG